MQAKNQNKTVPTKVSVNSFLESESFSAIEIKSAKILIKIFEKVTKKKCIMWGKIFGFGTYHYIGKSRQGDWMATGFALRKNAITVYIMSGVKSYPELLKDLGEFKVSDGSCLYIKKLEDVDLNVLEKLIKVTFLDLQKKWQVV
jgi:hypothetical protein